MTARSAALRLATSIVLVATAGYLGGCAIGAGPEIDARAGLACVDDSPECISRRQTTLKSMVDDKNRAWVKEPPTPEAYASGVRLFALKTKKKELSCDELAHGKREADAARASLANAGSKLTHAQVTRGNMLATEVSRELQREMKSRCKVG
jgi:hypothetical protein